jgi:hypothetical protein
MIYWEIDNKILKNNAVQKVSTLNPSTKLLHNKIINALMTNKNNPKVKIVIGSVNKIKTGLTNRFNNPKTMATIMEVAKFATDTPGRNLAISKTKTEVSKILINKFIF